MAYTALTVEGGLFPPDLLDAIAAGGGIGQSAADFSPDISRLSDEIQAAFSDTRAFWDVFHRRLATSKESRTSLTRAAWVIPLLERLGFDQVPYIAEAARVGGDTFAISHRAGEEADAPPVHIVALGESLGSRGAARRSPHAMVQEYLNRSDALWGLVTNGEQLRLLRDSNRFSKPTYVEFDLRGMIEGNLYSEFVLLYRLIHRSRFPAGAADAPACLLERFYQAGLETGGRVREHLRDGVEKAIDELGAAFLRHPDSTDLRAAIASGGLTTAGYYRQLLRLVYRLLFLFVAEERKLLFPPGRADETTLRLHAIYDAYYSVARLRDRCDQPFAGDRHSDAWQGLLQTFRIFEQGEEAARLGLTALNGELFSGIAIRALQNAGCENSAFLRALRHLSVFRDGAVWRRVNYGALDVEELGSVYESLLDLQPSIDLNDTRTPFRLISGTERKTTGSYYTPGSLVHELIESALVPVIGERLAGAKTPAEKEAALLGIRVCDPAAGSGHFLLAAARRLGKELAIVRTGEASPAPEAYREAVRDVIRSCIYAVDKNPLASDLCKVALWIEGHHSGLPLSFLDHHVKAGDSLVGVFDPEVLKAGIPDEAYAPVTGDDKKIASGLKAFNAKTRAKSEEGYQQPTLDIGAGPDAAESFRRFGEKLRAVAAMPERTPDEVRIKEESYIQLREDDPDWNRFRIACDLWTAAFFLPMDSSVGSTTSPLFPTTETVNTALSGRMIHGQIAGRVAAVTKRLGFFHWPLEFPEVFKDGGFDIILANPPWEQVQPEEVKFFASRDRDIAAEQGAKRKMLIAELPKTNPELATAWTTYVTDTERTSKFLRTSKRYPLTSVGKVNLYSTFAELITIAVGPMGRAGVIVPTGIATDDTNKRFFGSLVTSGKLRTLYDFENRDGIFPGVHRSYKFSLLGVGAAQLDRRFDAAFFLAHPDQLREPDTIFPLTADEIALLNPNTKTCPIFRTARDAEITKQIYQAAPVLVREGPPEVNPWGVTLKQGLFNMTGSSHLFRTRTELEAAGLHLGTDGRFRSPHVIPSGPPQGGVEGSLAAATWLPLYEAKMIHQFDHRFATYEGSASADKARDFTLAEHADPDCVALPRYWVVEREIDRSINGEWNTDWYIGFRRVARNTDVRSAIFSVMPRSGAGDSVFILNSAADARKAACLIGLSNSIPFDFVVRQKAGGINFNFFIVKQLPVLPPETYTPALLDEIVPRVVELVYTAHDMAPFARDCGHDGPPFVWDEERRARLRADLDGIYAHLYGLSRDDFAYILDTFPIVRRNDEKAFGEYRTKRLCLEAYDARSPEHRRSLEDEVKAIEGALRGLIVRTLGSDSAALPVEIREPLIEEQRKQLGKRATPAYAASMASLLESAYLLTLQKIIAGSATWPRFASRFESKGKFESNLYHLSALRNTLAHGRTLDDATREKGEAAVRWFASALGGDG